MGASPGEDKPILPRYVGDSSRRPEGDTSRPSNEDAESFRWCGVAAAVLAAFVTLIWYVVQANMPLEYTVAITGVSGLDPVTDLQQGRGLLNPVFNLTVGIAVPSAVSGGCIRPGTAIQVSYSHLHIPVAGGRAPDMCVGPWKSSGPHQAVAGGHAVALPGFLVDSLAEDIRRGDAMFEVKLTGLDDADAESWKIVRCWVRLGDATGAALKMPCQQYWRRIDSVPTEDSGYVPQPVPVADGPH
ncbi:hypothetical protein EJB05_20755, partial [Eragrostis curvula]